jgi:hypothetical protein
MPHLLRDKRAAQLSNFGPSYMRSIVSYRAQGAGPAVAEPVVAAAGPLRLDHVCSYSADLTRQAAPVPDAAPGPLAQARPGGQC